MMDLGRTKINLKISRNPTTVPDNPFAHLMYYLSCVSGVIKFSMTKKMKRLIDYQNWRSLSREDVKDLFAFCGKYSPDRLNNVVFFQSDKLCGTSLNRFATLDEVNDRFLVVQNVVFAAQGKREKEIMFYKPQWLDKYYYEPVRRFQSYFSRN